MSAPCPTCRGTGVVAPVAPAPPRRETSAEAAYRAAFATEHRLRSELRAAVVAGDAAAIAAAEARLVPAEQRTRARRYALDAEATATRCTAERVEPVLTRAEEQTEGARAPVDGGE